MKKFYTLFLIALMGIGSVWAQTYNGGTWYSVYEEEEITNVVIGSEIATWDVFAPASGTVTFDYKKLAFLTVNGKVKVQTSADGNNFSEIGSVSYSDYNNYKSGSVSGIPANIKKMKFVNTSTGSQTKNVKLPLARHILLSGGDFGKSSVSKTFTKETRVGESSDIRADFRSFLTNGNISISLTEGDAEVFRLGSADNISGVLTTSTAGNTYAVGANACASANGTVAACANGQLGKIDNYSFQIYFCPKVGGEATGKITITDGTSTATITVKATGIKAETLEVPVELSFCAGGSVEFHGKTYTEAETDVVEATGASRDTVYNVTVSVLQPSFGTDAKTIVYGAQETWNEIDLSTYMVGKHEIPFNTTNVAGCDSTVTLTLTVNKQETLNVPLDLAFCAGSSETYRGVEYSEAGTYKVPAEGATRDTLYVINVTVLQPSFGTEEMTMYVGEEIEWNGIALKDSTVGEHTVIYETTNVAGCDSTVTLSLTVLERPTTYGVYEAKFCEGDSVEFAGKWYFEATQEDVTLEEKNVFGGDSIVALTVTMLPVYAVVEKDTVVQDSIYEWQGETLTTSELGTFEYTKEYTSVEGCDSIITLYLTVVEPEIIEPEDPTGLEQIEAMQKAVKEFRNGVLYIRREGKEFTLDGRLVK